MNTPALNSLLIQLGKVVHHLNTIAVGLSAVESGSATKPIGLDVSWSPSDVVTSARQARAYTLRVTIVTVAEEINAFVSDMVASPACSGISLPSKPDRALKLEKLKDYFSLKEDHLFLGPLLLLHWRNRIIHRGSTAALTKAQCVAFIGESSLLQSSYKNLDPSLLLEHFNRNTPTLKDVSSLVAMTINFARAVSDAVSEPASDTEVMHWLTYLKLTGDLDRVKRVAASKGKLEKGISTFLRTNCPSLEAPYFFYCHP